MIRDIISNDSLTIILLVSLLYVIILKRINPTIFDQNLSFKKKELINKISNSLLGIKSIEILYNFLFISNLSILLTFFKNKNFELFVYYELLGFVSIFFVVKIMLDFSIGRLFSISELMKNYIWQKLVYHNSLGILLLLFNFFIAYSIFDGYYMTLISIYISLVFLLFSYCSIYFSMKKVIIKNWFYFILYLCTLEIIPYYYLISNVL